MIKFTNYSLNRNRSGKFIEVFTKNEIGLNERATSVVTHGKVKVALLKGRDGNCFHTLIIGDPDITENLVFMLSDSPELPRSKKADSCWMTTFTFFSFEDLKSFIEAKGNIFISDSTFKLLLKNNRIERIEKIFGNNSGIRYFIKK